MLKLLGSIAVLAVVAAGCGSDEPEPSAAGLGPTAVPTIPADVRSAHRFEKGHSRAVREYYGGTVGDEQGGSDVEAEYHHPPRPASGGIGDTITLTGSNIGVRMRATVTGLVDPVRTSKPPRAGMRYAAVKVRMRSTGIAILEGELREAVVDYGGGRPARAVLGVEAGCSNGWEAGVRIEDGRPARGCLLFQLPRSARPRELEFALENVPAEAGGRWSLR
jgi:hypothetical protein